MNTERTLNGISNRVLRQISLPSTKDAILVDGGEGEKGQVLAKNENTNKLEWSFVDKITIPDNSISGDKLQNDITFSTTGLIRANEFFSNYFIVPQNGTQQVIIDNNGIIMVGNLTIDAYDTELRIDSIICSGNGGTDPTILVQDGGITLSDGMLQTFISGTDAIRINNGGDIALYSDNSQNLTMRIDANSGNITIFSNGKIQTYGVDEIMRILNGGKINLYDDNTGVSKTISIDGETGTITCEDLNVNNHTGIIEFNEIKTDKLTLPITGTANCEILSSGNIITNGSITGGSIVGTSLASSTTITATGSITGNSLVSNSTITAVGLVSGGSLTTAGLITATGTSGYIGVGTFGDSYRILLEKDGTITCEDLNINNHTGIIEFNEIKTDKLTLPITGTATCEILSSGNIITNGSITGGSIVGTSLASSTTINATSSITGNSLVSNSTITATDDITSDTGDIISLTGTLRSDKVGSKPAPVKSSPYTDWALSLATNNSHAFIGGNLICNGTIYANVEGTITEEEVDCQRITIRTATPPLTGITGMILGSGAEITNDRIGNLELTIDADTSGIVCNNISVLNNNGNDTALNVVGNVNLSTGSSRTTTIGNFGNSNQTLEVLCQNVNIGETAGNQQNNILNYRGGVHTFTGEKVKIGERLGYLTDGCNLEGSAGIGTNNIYYNEIKYFNINGRYISHDLSGTTQNFVIYKSNTSKGVEVPSVAGFSNSSTTYLQPISFNFVDLVAPTNTCKITIQSYYRHISGNPDLRCRIDETQTGATAYPSQVGGPRIIKNSINQSGAETQHKYDFIITGLLEGNTYSFYPKYAHTTGGRGFLCYGGAFGEMYMYIEWLESYNGVVKDPYSPILTGQEILGETLQSYSYIDNEAENFTRIYNTSNKWIFDGNQDSGTDTLEVHFTASSTTGYLEFGFYANSLTAGMIFMCGVAVGTGGTSPFSTTLTSSAVSIDAYKQGLFNGDTTQYSLKELLDFTSYENTYITSKFHFNNLTIGTEYKMALYGRCHNNGSIYINSGGKSDGTTNRSAHQASFLKFYHFDSNLRGARTDDPYIAGEDK